MEIIEYTSNENGGFINHKALVKLLSENSKNDVVHELSERVGYHPAGYGLYGVRPFEKILNNTYMIEWQTGSSCD